MRNPDWLIILLTGVVIGYFLGGLFAYQCEKTDAVRHNAAHYDSQTGRFE